MQSLLIIPEPVYMILLLCSWVAAMFTGIGFVYGIQMKKEKWAVWGIVFFLCLCLIFLLMNGTFGEQRATCFASWILDGFCVIRF